MGQIREKSRSIKWIFIKYIPICIILSYVGAAVIGYSTNNLQDWYEEKYADGDSSLFDSKYIIAFDEDKNLHYDMYEKKRSMYDDTIHFIGYQIISGAQLVLIPLWILLVVMLVGILFYRRELEEPITILLEASEKIADSNLDFHIAYGKMNELGQLCQSFEKMRDALYQNNREMWRMLEERKKLNAAFSHDMRTPITVIKGYRDLLEKYIPSGEVPEEKTMQILKMMRGQIDRLENYTQKMSAVQKLEDIAPLPKEVNFQEFLDKCVETSKMLAEGLHISYQTDSDTERLCVDEELVLEVFENLVSNAVRYAKDKLQIDIGIFDHVLTISVEDDGPGFTEEALQQAAKPFYRDRQEEKNHFGLGLYICKIICEKCQGELVIESGRIGGKVTASFKAVKQN
ncbi:MAG: HAMP domain-containing histidine kinase [Lachnospiraceae bacterium]|nr:HAMP domain-containing histidine kinase [Lachnospiraceae bacterium]